MKCWDSFDKSNMLLIFLLNEKCCAAKIVCCYQFLSLLSGMTKISGHTTPHHTSSGLAGEAVSGEDCRAGNDRTPFLASSSSSLSQTSLPQGGPHSHSHSPPLLQLRNNLSKNKISGFPSAWERRLDPSLLYFPAEIFCFYLRASVGERQVMTGSDPVTLYHDSPCHQTKPDHHQQLWPALLCSALPTDIRSDSWNCLTAEVEFSTKTSSILSILTQLISALMNFGLDLFKHTYKKISWWGALVWFIIQYQTLHHAC